MNASSTVPATHFFRDKRGKIVIWQWPNIPLYGWLIFTLLAMAVDHQWLKTSFYGLGKAWLVTWAYLELTQGVNYFRKLLGLLVLLALLVSFFIH